MKCFVITKKHIIFAIATAIIIPLSIICTKSAKTETVPAFKPNEIVKEALPSNENINIISRLKERIKKEMKSESILNSYSAAFDKNTPSPSPTQAPKIDSTPAPTSPVGEKQIIKTTEIKNETQYEITSTDFKDEPCIFPKETVVLIMHTHTTESYAEDLGNDNSRNINEDKNITAVGDVIQKELEAMGIQVIHDKTVHDYPSYQGAYGRSLKTVQRNIESNKNIGIVLDIHRDAVIKTDGTRVKLTSDINGECCAQGMVVCGTDGTGLSHPDWRSNLNFAIKLTDEAEKLAPGLMRPIDLREERFNQHLTEGSLIIEIGTNGNTLEEAKASAVYIGRAVGNVILKA